jgi:hypothetical protein
MEEEEWKIGMKNGFVLEGGIWGCDEEEVGWEGEGISLRWILF